MLIRSMSEGTELLCYPLFYWNAIESFQMCIFNFFSKSFCEYDVCLNARPWIDWKMTRVPMLQIAESTGNLSRSEAEGI